METIEEIETIENVETTDTMDTSEIYMDALEVLPYVPDGSGLVECDICGGKLSYKSLDKHRFTVHKIEKPMSGKFMHECSLCADDGRIVRFKQTQVYINHLNDVHNQIVGEITVLNKNFNNKEEFLEFKEDVLVQRLTQFSKRNSKDTATFYRCNRYAHPSLKTTPKQQKPNISGKVRIRASSKITSGCPVFLTTTKKNGDGIEAKFCLDHVGHDVDSDHIALKKIPTYEERYKLIEEIAKINEEFADSTLFKCGSLKALKNLKQTLVDVYKKFDDANPYSINKKVVLKDEAPRLLFAPPSLAPAVNKGPTPLGPGGSIAPISVPIGQSVSKVIQAVVPEDIARKIVPIPPPAPVQRMPMLKKKNSKQPMMNQVMNQFPFNPIQPTWIFIPNQPTIVRAAPTTATKKKDAKKETPKSRDEKANEEKANEENMNDQAEEPNKASVKSDVKVQEVGRVEISVEDREPEDESRKDSLQKGAKRVLEESHKKSVSESSKKAAPESFKKVSPKSTEKPSQKNTKQAVEVDEMPRKITRQSLRK